ncbi:MAG: dihydroorotate dehydrogenase-like protein [bacterium]|jgi:dihydroorotate dehydrogenase (fumarate)|nr:dihydroorotate dehydrogenase-like protein [bacterium]
MDLSTSYMGLQLPNPLIASASPLSRELDTVKRLEEAGVAAIVMYSLFEEEIRHAELELFHHLEQGSESFAEAMGYFPDLGHYQSGPDGYLEQIRRLKQALSIPVIASLNGVTPGGWMDMAHKMEQAGADGIELNIYTIPTHPDLDGAAVEQLYLDDLAQVRKVVGVPVAVKLSPFFSSLPNMARKLEQAGADALVLFNRFYQPDMDIENLEVVPEVRLSNSGSLRLPLRWTAILRSVVTRASLALSTGVHTGRDVIKATMAGADACQLCASLLIHGPEHARGLLETIRHWMEEHEYESLRQMKGSMSLGKVVDPAAFERANYMKALREYR